MTVKSVPHYNSVGSVDTDVPGDDDSAYSSMDNDTLADRLAAAVEQVQNTSSKSEFEAKRTSKAYRGMPLTHAGRRSAWPEIEPLEEDAPRKVVAGLSSVDKSLHLHASDDASSKLESAGAARTEKSRHNLPRGAMVGQLSCGSGSHLCPPHSRSQSKEKIGSRAGSKQLSRAGSKQQARTRSKQLSPVTECQTFIDSDVPDMGAPVAKRPPAQPCGFLEALQMMLNVHPSVAATSGHRSEMWEF